VRASVDKKKEEAFFSLGGKYAQFTTTVEKERGPGTWNNPRTKEREKQGADFLDGKRTP